MRSLTFLKIASVFAMRASSALTLHPPGSSVLSKRPRCVLGCAGRLPGDVARARPAGGGLPPHGARGGADRGVPGRGAGRARVATREEVVAATGFEPGAVAPFPHKGIDLVVVDRSLLTHERVWIGAGSPKHLACVGPHELLRLTKGREMDAVAD